MCIFGNDQKEENGCNKTNSVKVPTGEIQMAKGTSGEAGTDNHIAPGATTKSIFRMKNKGKN